MPVVPCAHAMIGHPPAGGSPFGTNTAADTATNPLSVMPSRAV
jgi:hypothetical protein